MTEVERLRNTCEDALVVLAEALHRGREFADTDEQQRLHAKHLREQLACAGALIRNQLEGDTP